ncbi:MAG: hypothetical protein AAB569_07115 [Patescibacteria group bacterium]
MPESIKGITNLDALKKTLLQYNLKLGPKTIPPELIPYRFPRNESILITDSTINNSTIDAFVHLSPRVIEKRLETILEKTEQQVENIRTDHFGIVYEAKSITFLSKEQNQPEGKMIFYNIPPEQEFHRDIFHPDFTFELMGYNEWGKRISVGVTCYKNNNHVVFIYSTFEETIGANISIGFPDLLPSFAKRLAKTFKLDQ